MWYLLINCNIYIWIHELHEMVDSIWQISTHMLYGWNLCHPTFQWDFQGPPIMGPPYGNLPILFP